MTDSEKTTCRFTSADKKAIAEAAQLEITDVEDVIQKHKQL
jgi:hypothetical protein